MKLKFEARNIRLLAAFAALLCSVAVHSQTVYRIVGPDGRVTFSDKPPTAEQGKVVPSSQSGQADSSASALPFELKSVAARYPVTLYTSKDCSICDSGRNILKSRGIPFAEKVVDSSDDISLFKTINSASTVPFLTVGNQKIQGFSDSEWNQYLDAAGYPKTSVLPASYRQSAASPLSPPKITESAVKQEKKPEEIAPPPPPAGPGPSNPTGIVF